MIPELELRRSEDLLKKAELAVRHAKTEAALSTKELGVRSRDEAAERRAAARGREASSSARSPRSRSTSPVDGQVGQLLVPQRASVAANAPMLTVVDLGAFELELKVPDSFARDLALGMSAEIRSGSQTFPATVRAVSPEVVDGNVATRLEFGDRTGPRACARTSGSPRAS